MRRSSCERGFRDLDLAGHAGGDRQHAVGAGEVAALADRLARKRDRFTIVPADELGVGGDAMVDRGATDRAGSAGWRAA